MFIVLKKSWDVRDGSGQNKRGIIPEGKHEVERIPSPIGGDSSWLVLKGTLIGLAESAWRAYNGPNWSELEVKIIE